MCYIKKCRACGKTTWGGCGKHVQQVMSDVPRDSQCKCEKTPEERMNESPFQRSERKDIDTMSSFFESQSVPGGYNRSLGNTDDTKAWLLMCIGRSLIGHNKMIPGPYRPLRLFYADYTASGRSIEFIERFIHDEIMPMYANTHTEASGTGRQTTHFREEARGIVADHLGCTDGDAVIFCGSGCTAAVNKLVHILNLRLPKDLDAKYGLKKLIPVDQRPVVFIGPYEHHSNELPWRESIADVIVIAESSDGEVDLDDLRAHLDEYKTRPLIIGSFSAASNVTGILTNIENLTVLLHSYGALALWDFAAAAPYIAMDMNPTANVDEIVSLWSDECKELWANRPFKASSNPSAIDAMFISPHKFLGGPGTAGILACKRTLLESGAPDSPGGGTVLFVNPGSHDYVTNPEAREEAGTPDIVGSIRAGLVFQLKDALGPETIIKVEDRWLSKVFKKWGDEPLIRILGSTTAPRLSIVSFMIRESPMLTEQLGGNDKTGIGRYLHHNFVVALLNDIFGIQGRGGCSCAGPYQHRLLNVSPEVSLLFRDLRRTGVNGITPGWARLNFHYVFTEREVDFLIDAVLWIAKEGWKLAPDYVYDPISGLWTHKFGHPELECSLHDVQYDSGSAEYVCRHAWGTSRMIDEYVPQADALVAERVAEMEQTGKQETHGSVYHPCITSHVEVTDVDIVAAAADTLSHQVRGSGWLRLSEDQRKGNVFICSDGSCASVWGKEIHEADSKHLILGTPPISGAAQCSVASGKRARPLVTKKFLEVYESVRWFATPDEILAVHLSL